MKNKIRITALIIAIGLIIISSKTHIFKKVEKLNTINSVPSNTNGETLSTAVILEINEDQFVGFINDLYENPADYEGNQIRIRGHYRTREVLGKTVHYIFQGTDERWIGMAIEYTGDYPTESAIVQVVGTLRVKTTDDKKQPILEIEEWVNIR